MILRRSFISWNFFFHRTTRKSCLGHRRSTRQNATRLDTRSDALNRVWALGHDFTRLRTKRRSFSRSISRSFSRRNEEHSKTSCSNGPSGKRYEPERVLPTVFFFFLSASVFIVVRLRSTASHARTSTPRESRSVRTQHP